MKKKITLFLTLFLCAAVYAQDLPRIAVYVTGEASENEKRALGTRVLAALANSGRYIAVERDNAFLAEIDNELEMQYSGLVDDNSVSALGRRFGVNHICIVNITPAFGAYQVSARIIDVETVQIVAISEAASSLRFQDDFIRTSDEVVRKMFPGPARVEPVYYDAYGNPVYSLEHADNITLQQPMPQVLPPQQTVAHNKKRRGVFWGVVGTGAALLITGLVLF